MRRSAVQRREAARRQPQEKAKQVPWRTGQRQRGSKRLSWADSPLEATQNMQFFAESPGLSAQEGVTDQLLGGPRLKIPGHLRRNSNSPRNGGFGSTIA